MCLAIVGVANQSETKEPHFFVLQQRTTSYTSYMITHENNSISSSLTYIFFLASFIANITHHQHDNNRTLQGFYCYACYLVSGTSGTKAA